MTSRGIFSDEVRIERRARAATNAREATQVLQLVSAASPCRIVDQTAQANVDSPLGRAGSASALISFLPEEDIELGDILTSLTYPTVGRIWRVTGRREISRHSLQCTAAEVQDQ